MISKALKAQGFGYCVVRNGDGVPRCLSVSRDGALRQAYRRWGRVRLRGGSRLLGGGEVRRVKPGVDGLWHIAD